MTAAVKTINLEDDWIARPAHHVDPTVSIHRRSHLHQAVRASPIQATNPGGDRRCRDMEHTGRLLQAPSTGCFQLRDCQSCRGRIVWTSMWTDRDHAGIFDPISSRSQASSCKA